MPVRRYRVETVKGQVSTNVRTACTAKVLSLLLLVALAQPAAVQAQDYTYTTNNGTITITRYSGYDSVVIIPSAIDELPVVSIGNGAFERCTSFSSVIIPDSVRTIGDRAFTECRSLTSVEIGNGVTSIGDDAFEQCTALSSVTIPNSVTNIGNWTFAECSSLTSLRIGNGVTSIGYSAFIDTRMTNVTIPDSVTSIGGDAFSHCLRLAEVTIGNSVTNIGSEAFETCIRLTSITIPKSVTQLGNFTFFDCPNMTAVYFEGNAPTVGSQTFVLDDHAVVYYLPGTTGWHATFGGRPTVMWHPQLENISVSANQFRFTITATTNLVILVEACTNLATPVWSSVGTNNLTDGLSEFTDPEFPNCPARFYRLRSP